MRALFLLLSGAVSACCSAGEVAAPGPRTPTEEAAAFQFADPDLTAELATAEPQVASPVAFCWDERYALYVAEMNDYPAGPRAGRIRKLVDADADGRYEISTVFADDLPFPSGVCFVRGGLLVTAAPDLWLLTDHDGDGVADERRVLWTGFGEGNQQLRANGLTWGGDGWVYGANGRSDGELRPGAGSPRREPFEPLSIRTRDFRLSPDGLRCEAALGQSQFGQTQTDRGDRLLSWNTIVARHALFDEQDAARWPRLATRAVHNLHAPADDDGEVFPAAPRPQTFNRESTSHFNALCGLTVYRAAALGNQYAGNLFVGESLSNLVHRRQLEFHGPTYSAVRTEQQREFLAGADPWFHPVYLTTGPDGCLYVADFYRRWVEHPQFVPEAWRAEVQWQEGAQYGRIWRIRRRDAPATVAPRPLDAWRAAGESTTGLVALLTEQTDGWHLDVIQRLLVERFDAAAAGALEELVLTGLDGADDELAARPSGAALARMRSLWTLEAAGALDESVLLRALHDAAADVREQAVRIAAPRLAGSVLLQETCAALTDDPSPRVRFQLARAWGAAPPDIRTTPLTELALADDADGWIGLAVCASAGSAAPQVLERLIAAPRRGAALRHEGSMMYDLASTAGAQRKPEQIAACVRRLLALPAPKLHTIAAAVVAGLGVGLADHGTTVHAALASAAKALPSQAWMALLREIAQQAHDAAAPLQERVRCVQALATAGDASSAVELAPLIDGVQPAELAAAALRAVVQSGDAAALGGVMRRWEELTASLRRQATAAAINSPALAVALAEQLEAGTVLAVEIDPAQRQALAQTADAELAQRFARAFAAAAPPPRDAVLAEYQRALELSPDRTFGAALFAQHCLTCHQMFGLGRAVGPDITGAGHKPKGTLLVELLDPSRQVSPDFLAYSVATRGGRVLTGLLVSDAAGGVTLRRGEGADDFIPRADVEQLTASGASLMPEGFEQKLTPQDVADVLEFLRLPERSLLSAAVERAGR